MIKSLLKIVFIPYYRDQYDYLETYCKQNSIHFYLYDPTDASSFIQGLHCYFIKTNFCFHAMIITYEKSLFKQLLKLYPRLVKYNSFEAIKADNRQICPICYSNHIMYQEGYMRCSDCGRFLK